MWVHEELLILYHMVRGGANTHAYQVTEISKTLAGPLPHTPSKVHCINLEQEASVQGGGVR